MQGPISRMVVTQDEAELATEAWGNPVRGTILLVMGATASMVWWPDSLMKALAAGGYQVIRFDHRDTGQSTTNPPGDVRYDLLDLAADLIAILDVYAVQSVHLVGMSLGGYVSQIAALRYPERVRTLTLIASEPLGVEYAGAGIAPKFMEHFATMADLDWSSHSNVARFMLRIAELSAGSASPFDIEAASHRIAQELQRASDMRSAFNHSMIGGELGPNMTPRQLDLPVLLVHGTEDPIISVAAARTAAQIIGGARLLLLDGRGHELAGADIPRIAGAILALTTNSR